MSSHSYTNPCPICENEMDINSTNKPFEQASGECLNCGFYYYTRIKQNKLEDINCLRADHNEGMELKEGDEDYLKPLTQEDLDKYTKEIEEL